MYKNFEERILSRIQKIGDCHLWIGAKFPNGQGKVNVGGVIIPVHRYVYTERIGSIPNKMRVVQVCGKKDCINTDHLELMTHAETLVSRKAHNSSKTHCPQGHEYSRENTLMNSLGNRVCRICNKNKCKKQYWKSE